jgi:hypothetical protein
MTSIIERYYAGIWRVLTWILTRRAGSSFMRTTLSRSPLNPSSRKRKIKFNIGARRPIMNVTTAGVMKAIQKQRNVTDQSDVGEHTQSTQTIRTGYRGGRRG